MVWKKSVEKLFIRDLDSQNLIETFLVSAVTAILAIRFYLYLTGYPQIGRGSFHIAHVLLGGILMLLGNFVFITFVNNRIKLVATVLSGFGFGAFIDELGKFITRDNNYFFQPTIALIYVVFVLVYLLDYALEKVSKPSKEEYLTQGAELIREAVYSTIEVDRIVETKNNIEKAGADRSIDKLILHVVSNLDGVPANKDLFDTIRLKADYYYQLITGWRYFSLAITLFFIGKVLVVIYESPIVTLGLWSPTGLGLPVLTFGEVGYTVSSIFCLFFIVLGIIFLKSNRILSFRLFKVSTLVSIFLVRFFDFYIHQFGALSGFIIDLLILIALNAMISQEKFKRS